MKNIEDRKKLFLDFVSNFKSFDLKLLRECLEGELIKKMVGEYISENCCKLEQKSKIKKEVK